MNWGEGHPVDHNFILQVQGFTVGNHQPFDYFEIFEHAVVVLEALSQIWRAYAVQVINFVYGESFGNEDAIKENV